MVNDTIVRSSKRKNGFGNVENTIGVSQRITILIRYIRSSISFLLFSRTTRITEKISQDRERLLFLSFAQLYKHN